MSRGLGDVYKRQLSSLTPKSIIEPDATSPVRSVSVGLSLDSSCFAEIVNV